MIRMPPDRLAELRAPEWCCGVVTDKQALTGKGDLATQFDGDEEALNFRVAEAKKAGYTPNRSDVYMGSAADRPGDPQGFVPRLQARTHLKKLKEKKSRQGPPRKKVRMAKNLVEQRRRSMIAADPGLAHVNQNELRQQIIEKHGSKGA